MGNQQKNKGWIAVSDRLPNPDTPVLAGYLNLCKHFKVGLYVYTCIDQDEGDCYTWLQCGGVWHTKRAIDWCGARGTTKSITHWQPLPEPPVL